ncbi:MAG TPA: amidohydrolase [Pyrinomonadaceae bacterium]|nr:amidohydrolase [Pyrinomonadaceae bacterium]
MKNLLIILTTLLLLTPSLVVSQTVSADLVIRNANIRTMDENRSVVRAIAVLNGRIIALGSDAEIGKLIGSKTRVIDGGGKTIIPGFNDAHLHFVPGGQQLSLIDLRSSRSPEEFAERIKDYAAKLKEGDWITGGRWDHENWTPANLPTKELIDKAASKNPVFVNRLDGHMAVANSLALKLAGVTKDTKDVAGGVIVRDSNGEPTGVLKDAAMDLVSRIIPDQTFEQRLASAEAATNYAASLGVTSAQDMQANQNLAVYETLFQQGKLKTRLYAGADLADWQSRAHVGIRHAFGGPMLRTGTLKGYGDGSLGSSTAWFFEPYADTPSTSGVPSAEMPHLYEHISAADKNGLQVMIHAIGDKTNATVLDIYERVEKEDGPADRRFRIEHAQHLRVSDIPRFAKLGVIASMQPVHLTDDGRWAEKRLGKERLKGTYAFKSLLASGAHVAFGTDWSVAPLNPLFGIYAAVTRRTTDDKNPNGWLPDEKISVDAAVRCYTLGSAYAEFQENEKGTLEVGKLADMVILSEDIFTIDPTTIANVKVLTTIVGGKVVFDSDSAAK